MRPSGGRCMTALASFARLPGSDSDGTGALRRALAGADTPAALQAAAAQARCVRPGSQVKAPWLDRGCGQAVCVSAR